MEDNRRSFLKSMTLASSAFFIQPDLASIKTSEEVKQRLAETKNDIYRHIEMEVDVVVVGGGISGMCAALAAARNGMKVVLLQDRSVLGGNASSEIRMHISGSSVLETVWREVGLLEEMVLDDAVMNPQVAYPMWDFVMYNKVITEPNIHLLLDTMMYDVVMDGDRIKQVLALCSQTEERYTIGASQFADCTGDGTMAALSGADFMRGREAKSEYDESLGQEVADEAGMGNSLLFMAEEYDAPMPFTPPAWARKYDFEDFKYRGIYSIEYGYWWLELAGKYDIIHDGHQLRYELLSVLFGVWDYIKNSGNYPDSTNWALNWVGMIPGKRESRRIVGDYVMTQHDTQVSKDFPDRVAYGGWPLDDHPTEGMDDTSIKPNRAVHLKAPYSIPLRSLYSVNIENLWMAGRNISVSHVALSSTRVMATCSTLGQAVGVAMAYSQKNTVTGRQIVSEGKHMETLQQILLRQDQSMLKIVNKDVEDKARKASVEASDEEAGGKAENVIDGYNRMEEDGLSHQWQAKMVDTQPWISLIWKEAVDLSQVEFTFDTGLHRYLRISGQKVVMKGQVRGPQPETVADYKIEGFRNGEKVLTKIFTENYYRKVVHPIDRVKVDKLRCTVLRNHGDDYARIFEIRCY